MLPETAQQAILKNVARHIKLDAEEEAFFLSLFEYKVLKKKEVLLYRGDICRHDYYIVSGCLRCFDIDENGAEHISVFAIEDWWASDMYSFITQTPARVSIDALENTEILQISKHNIERLYVQLPKVERLFRIMLQNAYIALERRILNNLSGTAEERFEAFNAKYPGLYNRIPQKYIALYLGITPEFLSMLRKKAMQRRFLKIL